MVNGIEQTDSYGSLLRTGDTISFGSDKNGTYIKLFVVINPIVGKSPTITLIPLKLGSEIGMLRAGNITMRPADIK